MQDSTRHDSQRVKSEVEPVHRDFSHNWLPEATALVKLSRLAPEPCKRRSIKIGNPAGVERPQCDPRHTDESKL